MCKISQIYFAFGYVFLTIACSMTVWSQKDLKPDPACLASISRTKNTISFGVVNWKALKLVKPEYPPLALIAGVEDKLVVQVLIDPCGSVSQANVVSGHPLLKHYSLKAAKASIFKPLTISGKAVWGYGTIIYNYSSDKKPENPSPTDEGR